MENLTKLSEMLDTLMFEREINLQQLSKEVGIDATTLGRYLHSRYTPTVENLVKLANYFNCTADYLIGREPENYITAFYPCPPFAKQLKVLKDYFKCSWWHFYKTAHISSSRFYEWKNGKRNPTLDSIIFLADGFDCTVDFIIGRTKM